jgi:hypothetical protein
MPSFLNKLLINGGWSPKLLRQFKNKDDLYHTFPITVDIFASQDGSKFLKKNGDGTTVLFYMDHTNETLLYTQLRMWTFV